MVLDKYSSGLPDHITSESLIEMLGTGIQHVPQLQYHSSTQNHGSAHCAWPMRTQTNSEMCGKYVKCRCNSCEALSEGQKKEYMLPVQDMALKGQQ